MKKRFIIILFMVFSTFFFISLNEVKAYDIEVEVDLSLLNDDFYILKSLAEDFVKNSDDYDNFVIVSYSWDGLVVGFIPKNDNGAYWECYVRTDKYVFVSFYDKLARYSLDSTSTGLVKKGSMESYQSFVFNNSSFIILYANFDFVLKNDGSTINYIYNDFSVLVKSDGVSTLKTYFDFKEEYDEYKGDKELIHKKEFASISNFYTLCFEKLSYFSEALASNYIFLSILVILILDFIFELIRRYLM